MTTDNDKAILAALGSWEPPADIPAARISWENYAERLNQDLPRIGAFHQAVDLGGGLRADIAVPSGTSPFPVVLYLHGGGWAFGSPKSVRKLGMSFAAAGYLAVNLDYRLAPEHPFPAALDDVGQAIDWIVGNVAGYGGDGRRIAVGGDSAGANLALAAALASPARRRQLSALLLFYGVYDLAAALERSGQHPGLVLQVRSYLGDRYPAALSDPLVSPLKASMPHDLPACFILEGSADPFVGGEAAAIAAALEQAGVAHELHIIDGMPHGFMQMSGLGGCTEGWRRLRDFLHQRL